jgi:hypothetical protein
MTFSLAMANDPSWIPPGLTNTADAVEHLLKLLGAIGFAYVLTTGLAYRAGTRRGQNIAENLRAAEGKPNLKPFPDDGNDTPFWKDNALLQGGIKGIFIMAILFSYVVIMLAVFRPPASVLPMSLSLLMIYPNMMAGFFVFAMGLSLRKLKVGVIYALILLSIVAAVLSLVIIVKAIGAIEALTIQLLLCVFQSAVIAYFMGIFRGSIQANLEKRFPLVAVTTTDGHTRSDLRVMKIGASDCRFMEPDGSASLIPKSKNNSVRTL